MKYQIKKKNWRVKRKIKEEEERKQIYILVPFMTLCLLNSGLHIFILKQVLQKI